MQVSLGNSYSLFFIRISIFVFTPDGSPGAQGLLHGADQRADGTTVATGIARVAPLARAPPARPDGAGTGSAKKSNALCCAAVWPRAGALPLASSTAGLTECETAVKGFKGAEFKSFASREEALIFLEQRGMSRWCGSRIIGSSSHLAILHVASSCNGK